MKAKTEKTQKWSSCLEPTDTCAQNSNDHHNAVVDDDDDDKDEGDDDDDDEGTV